MFFTFRFNMIRKCNKTIQKNYKLFKKVFANIISLSKMLFKIISAYFFEVALIFFETHHNKGTLDLHPCRNRAGRP